MHDEHTRHAVGRAPQHDTLTGLADRHALGDWLDAAVRRAGRPAVLLVDVDRFRLVNEALGHAAGDTVLVELARRLTAVTPATWFVGRFGDDEFVVAADGVHDDDALREVTDGVERVFREPFAVTAPDGRSTSTVRATASIGAAFAHDGEPPEDLLQRADTALAHAKDDGRARIALHDPAMERRTDELLHLDHELRLALERGELRVVFQPKVDVGTGRITGAEALVRWQHPTRGLVHPAEFIGAAEETGLIARVGAWVLDRALGHAAAWADRLGGDGFTLAVNVSARQLRAPNLAATVAHLLTEHGWPAQDLVLELTESALVDDDAGVPFGALEELRWLGVRLAVDDFGTGYSSLAYLHRLPVDLVKIDRSFVRSLRAGGSGSPVTAAVIQLAGALGLRTVAEGVERVSQLAGLRALGCHQAQGFLFSPPVPAPRFEELLDVAPSW